MPVTTFAKKESALLTFQVRAVSKNVLFFTSVKRFSIFLNLITQEDSENLTFKTCYSEHDSVQLYSSTTCFRIVYNMIEKVIWYDVTMTRYVIVVRWWVTIRYWKSHNELIVLIIFAGTLWNRVSKQLLKKRKKMFMTGKT